MPTLNLQIAAGGNDGVWTEGNSTFTTTSVNNYPGGFLDSSFGVLNAFYRFTNVTIPQGSTISSAVMTFRANASNSGTVHSTVSAVAADNPSAPANYSAAETATRTSATVSWSSVASWTSGNDYTSPDISTVIQEIVNRGGWSSGNALIVYTEDNGSTQTDGNWRRAQSYDASAAQAPKLDITYTEGVAGPTIERSFDSTDPSKFGWKRGVRIV